VCDLKVLFIFISYCVEFTGIPNLTEGSIAQFCHFTSQTFPPAYAASFKFSTASFQNRVFVMTIFDAPLWNGNTSN